MKKVKITVMKTARYTDLMEKYENPLTHACDMSEGQVFVANGWTWATAVSVILFFLLHWPCSTTLLTIKKETGSWKWTALAAALPTVIGVLLCMGFTALVRCFS